MGNTTKGSKGKGKGKGKGTTTPTPTTKGGNHTVEGVVGYTKPPKVTPKDRKGTSTVPNPVAFVWVTCVTLTHTNGGDLHPRRVYTHHAVQGGVTYNTTRTQVQRYLSWVKGGCNPGGLPKGVDLNPNTLVKPGVSWGTLHG